VRETETVSQRILADRYRLGEEIGRGGMSVVVKATDERLGRTVAVKLLELDETASPGAIERFRREAQIAASLNHPNIVTVFDTGVDGTTAFLVMELLPGPNLVRKVAVSEKLSIPEILEITDQVCRALTAAHESGVVHRDIKPSNIAYANGTTVKVLDFGVARLIETTTGQTELTRTSLVIGTAAYLSPEQARGDSVTSRTDLYALGCVLFTLVSGEPPFRGENALTVCSQHLHTDPPKLVEIVPHVPPALSTLVGELLEKDPSRRPADAEIVRRRISEIDTISPGNGLPFRLRPNKTSSPIDDLTVLSRTPDDVTAMHEHTTIRENVSPAQVTTQMDTTLLGNGGALFHRRSSSVTSPVKRHKRRRRRQMLAVLVVTGLFVGVLVSQLGDTPVTPSTSTPSTTSTVAGTAPLPARLANSLNDLARSVGS
jgi:serine/threonine protein kinase